MAQSDISISLEKLRSAGISADEIAYKVGELSGIRIGRRRIYQMQNDPSPVTRWEIGQAIIAMAKKLK